MFNNLIKLGLYFSLIGEGRLDPMAFELINEERRRQRADEARKAQPSQPEDTHSEDIREAA